MPSTTKTQSPKTPLNKRKFSFGQQSRRKKSNAVKPFSKFIPTSSIFSEGSSEKDSAQEILKPLVDYVTQHKNNHYTAKQYLDACLSKDTSNKITTVNSLIDFIPDEESKKQFVNKVLAAYHALNHEGDQKDYDLLSEFFSTFKHLFSGASTEQEEGEDSNYSVVRDFLKKQIKYIITNSKNDKYAQLFKALLSCDYCDFEVFSNGQENIANLIQNENPKIVQHLLEKDGLEIEWNTTNTSGNTILHIMAQCGSCVGVEELVKGKGIKVDAINASGNSALHIAAHYNSVALINDLLANGANINQLNKDQYTALQIAASHKNKKAVEALLGDKNAADIYIKAKNGYTALHVAALTENNHEIINLLLKSTKINAVDTTGNTALHIAVLGGYISNIDALVVCVGCDNSQAFINMKNENDQTALFLASTHGKYEVVGRLSINGADHTSADESGNTALHAAALAGHIKVVEKLLEYGADPNMQNNDGNTPLFHAVTSGKSDEVVSKLVEKLLEYGADPNMQNNDGNTPLFHAVTSGKSNEVVSKLFSVTKKVHTISNKNGENLLFVALSSGRGKAIECVLDLIEKAECDDNTKKAIFFAVDNQSSTVLHAAVNTPNLEILKAVYKKIKEYSEKTERKALINHMNDTGKTVLDLVPNQKIIQFLKRKEAKYSSEIHEVKDNTDPVMTYKAFGALCGFAIGSLFLFGALLIIHDTLNKMFAKMQNAFIAASVGVLFVCMCTACGYYMGDQTVKEAKEECEQHLLPPSSSNFSLGSVLSLAVKRNKELPPV